MTLKDSDKSLIDYLKQIPDERKAVSLSEVKVDLKVLNTALLNQDMKVKVMPLNYILKKLRA